MTGAGWTAPLRPIISTERLNRSAGFKQQHAREASNDPHGRNHTGSGSDVKRQEGLRTKDQRSPFAVRRSMFDVDRSGIFNRCSGNRLAPEAVLTGPAHLIKSAVWSFCLSLERRDLL